MRLEKGQVFSIYTASGFGFLQYLETDNLGVEYVRILDPIKNSQEISQDEINQHQRWCCGFPLKSALSKKLIEYIGPFDLPPKYKVDDWTRSPHNIQGKHLGWHIVNRETLERKFKKTLKRKHLKLSPHGVSNDTLIKERLEKGWKLNDWKPFD